MIRRGVRLVLERGGSSTIGDMDGDWGLDGTFEVLVHRLFYVCIELFGLTVRFIMYEYH